MKISYLPIFLALASSLDAQEALLSSLLELDLVGLLTSVLSMAMPTEVCGLLSQNVEEVFSSVPLGPSVIDQLASLDVLKSLGRRKRSAYTIDWKTKKPYQPLATKNRNNPDSKPLLYNRKDVRYRDIAKPYVQNTPFSKEYYSQLFSGSSKIDQTFTKRTTERKRRSNDEGEPDVQSKATETAMRGMGMVQKGMESSKMAAEAGSHMAQSGKAGAEGLASGADMMGGAAETIAAGAEQIQSMIPG